MPPSGTVQWYGRAPEHCLIATTSSNPTEATLPLAHSGCDAPVWHSSVVRPGTRAQPYHHPSSNPGKATLGRFGIRAKNTPVQIPDKTNNVPTRRTKIPRQQTHWKLYRYQKELSVSRTSVLSSRQPKVRASKSAPTKLRYIRLGPLGYAWNTSEHWLSPAPYISHLQARLTKSPMTPPRQKNQFRMIGGLYMLMGPPARPEQESDSSSKHQPENGWSNPSVWIFPLQTMKLNMKPSCPDCALQPP